MYLQGQWRGCAGLIDPQLINPKIFFLCGWGGFKMFFFLVWLLVCLVFIIWVFFPFFTVNKVKSLFLPSSLSLSLSLSVAGPVAALAERVRSHECSGGSQPWTGPGGGHKHPGHPHPFSLPVRRQDRAWHHRAWHHLRSARQQRQSQRGQHAGRDLRGHRRVAELSGSGYGRGLCAMCCVTWAICS